jgi:hypothetical protein
MHNDLNLTPLLRQKHSNYPRTIGRYNSSELYYIINGLTSPEEWLNPKSRPLPLLMAMWNGTLVHQYIQDLLPSECNEVKIEYQHTLSGTEDVITLVAKIDHLPNYSPYTDEAWEFKTSKNELPEAKAEHVFQAKTYCTVAKKSIAKVFQPVQHVSGLYLKHLETVNRDDVWFEEQMKKLEDFHYQVLAIEESLNK